MNSPRCPMCGRELYLEESTQDRVCIACCGTRGGDRYTLLSNIEENKNG